MRQEKCSAVVALVVYVCISVTVLLMGSPFVSCDGIEAVCGGHGSLHGDRCQCDPDYVADGDNSMRCVPREGRDAGECGGHGDLHGGHCDCDSGYVADDRDIRRCVPLGDAGLDEHGEDHHNEDDQRDGAACGLNGKLHGGHCDCDPGYVADDITLRCISYDSWLLQLGAFGETPNEHIWHLLRTNNSQDPVGREEIQALIDMASGIYPPDDDFDHGDHGDNNHDKDENHENHGDDDHKDHGPYGHDDISNEDHDHVYHSDDDHDDDAKEECSGHGHLANGECHCDTGYDLDTHNAAACIPEAPWRRRLAQDLCGGHGHPHGGECHCTSGYITDPADSLNCIPEGAVASASSTAWKLRAEDIIAVARSSNGEYVYIESLAVALPLLVSCQMDPACSLETTSPAAITDNTGDKTNEVELWMALVSTLAMLIIPIIGMAIPYFVYDAVNGRTMIILVSLGNCLTAALILSLAVMHIIPKTVEAQFKAGIDYPLNYLIIVIGFFATLFLETAFGAHPDVALSKKSVDASSMKVQQTCFSIEDLASGSHHQSGGIDGSQSSGKVQSVTSLVSSDVSLTTSRDILVALPETLEPQPKNSNMHFWDKLGMILPLLIFFLAIQFHATLECAIVGIQTSANNFWTLVIGISLHKAFVSFTLGVKLHENHRQCPGNHIIIIIFAALWALLPALSLIISYLVADELDNMAKLTLSSLAGGTFLYIGSFEVLSKEFQACGDGNMDACCTKAQDEDGRLPAWGTRRSDRLWKFAFISAGVAMVAAISVIPHKHD